MVCRHHHRTSVPRGMRSTNTCVMSTVFACPYLHFSHTPHTHTRVMLHQRVLPATKVVTAFCDHYRSGSNSSAKGVILRALNVMRLKADSLQPSDYLRRYLHAHDSWKSFKPTLLVCPTQRHHAVACACCLIVACCLSTPPPLAPFLLLLAAARDSPPAGSSLYRAHNGRHERPRWLLLWRHGAARAEPQGGDTGGSD